MKKIVIEFTISYLPYRLSFITTSYFFAYFCNYIASKRYGLVWYKNIPTFDGFDNINENVMGGTLFTVIILPNSFYIDFAGFQDFVFN